MFPVPLTGTDSNDSLCCILEYLAPSLFLRRGWWLFVSQCPFDTTDGTTFSSIRTLMLWDIASDFCVRESGWVKSWRLYKSVSTALLWMIFSSNVRMVGGDSVSWSLLSSLLVATRMWGSSTSTKRWLCSAACWCLESTGLLSNRWSWKRQKKITQLCLQQHYMSSSEK